MITDLFANFLYSEHIDVDNQNLESLAYNIRNNSPGVFASNEGGWQSESVQHEPLLQELLEQIKHHANVLHTSIGLNGEFYEQCVGNIWININGFKNFNNPHVHPNSCFSGVYYIKVKPMAGGIHLMTPNPGYYYTIPPYVIDDSASTGLATNKYLGEGYVEAAQEGKLIIFPSWLMHFTQPNLSDSDRISIAFNTYIKRK